MQIKVISIILIFSIFLNITGCGTSSNNINNTETQEKYGLAPLTFLKYWGLFALIFMGVGLIIGKSSAGVSIGIVGSGLLFVSIPIYFVYWIINGIVYYND